MLAIGRALMSAPRILLLDEPSPGLSPLIMQEVLTVIRQLRDQGIAIVLVEQIVHNALSVANRAYVLTTGRIVAEDSAAGLLKTRICFAPISAAECGSLQRVGRADYCYENK